MLKKFQSFHILYIKYILIGLILLSFYDNNYASCDTLILNSNLAECYRKENLKPLVPNTLQILLEIIRKLENGTNTAGDIRFLSAKLLHNIRVDGVQKDVNATESEFVIPYSASALMTHKNSILLKLVSNVPGEIKFHDYLTPLEICTLHKIISSTVESSLRGDEHLTCRQNGYDFPANRVVENNNNGATVISYQISRCPVEGGVIRTKNFGTISPGILIASIAAGLQPQAVQIKEIFPFLQRSQTKNNFFKSINDDIAEDEDVEIVRNKTRKLELRVLLLSSMNDRVNNTYASNLAGDLAEVCLFQSPYYGTKVHVGTFGYWNNLEYPVAYYVNDSNKLNWFMTDSEILSGIDGYYLANNVHSWVSKISLLRLSQVIEMYYSKKGVPNFKIENSKRRIFSRNDEIGGGGGVGGSDGGLFFKTFDDSDADSNSACRRRNILKNIERQKLKYETYLFAKILQYTANTPFVEESVLKASCDLAVEQLFERATKLLNQFRQCEGSSRALINMILIVDGSRNQSENFKLISQISEVIDVTQSSSGFSVIHGGTGQYMIKSTRSIADGFNQLKAFDGRHPQKLSLTKSLSKIIFSLENSTSEESSKVAGLAPVIVIFSQSQKVLDNDFKDAKRLIEGSFKYNQNIYFIFITNDGARFEDLVVDERKNLLNAKDKFSIIETDDLDIDKISLQLLRKVRFIPKWLRPLSCDYNEYEDYVGTEHSNYYRINSYELKKNREMLVQFKVAESYGIITVCKNIDNQPSECISSRNSEFGEVWFDITEPCLDENQCPAINFMVELDTTNIKCTETTCRYPDDIRLNIRIKRSGCNSASSIKLSYNYCSILLFIYFIYYLLQNNNFN